jgi:hypothetical protein
MRAAFGDTGYVVREGLFSATELDATMPKTS